MGEADIGTVPIIGGGCAIIGSESIGVRPPGWEVACQEERE